VHPLYRHRRAGVLLHPTSLPGPLPRGQICHEAYRFVEFLQHAGLTVWQMLPLGPTHTDGSPYLALSAHAGNPELISLDWLLDRKLLNDVGPTGDFRQHRQQLELAWQTFQQHPAGLDKVYRDFVRRQADWLDDYSLFMAIRETQNNQPWPSWKAALRDRKPAALQQAQRDLASRIDYHRFCQFLFFQQWQDFKQYANRHRVLLFGDMPIYVSLDSADVWAHRELFSIDKHGKPQRVAGVPPDYFSATGQRWGNPLYRWDVMQQDDFSWWQRRMQTQLALFDLVRIDHFRGLRAYWDIPADAETATEGHWVEAPGEALLDKLHEVFPDLPLVAEDLGVITDDVTALRKQFALPGMKILQFAFDGNPNNDYLPHQHEFASVVYTGTHDNDTSLAWYHSLDDHTRRLVQEYLGIGRDSEMPRALIRAAIASVSCLAVIPMQDLLGLGEGHRMNTPGTMEGNWQWRFEWKQLLPELSVELHEMLRVYGRCPPEQ
jgi:4-alpha-glucanotransferase